MNPTVAGAADGDAMNARTTRRLAFQPVPGVAQNTKGASIPAGTPVRYDGPRLLASVDVQHDYEFTAPEPGDFEMDATSPYATEANPELQRHHWQGLFSLIASLRPEWRFDRICEAVFGCRNLLSFPELAATAIRTAQSPRFNGPGAIRLVITGLIEP